MVRKSSLRAGWHLLAPKSDAETARAVMQAAVDRLNGAEELAPDLRGFFVAPCRREMDPSHSYGQIARRPAARPDAFEHRVIMLMRPHPKPYTSWLDRNRADAEKVANIIEEARRFDPSLLTSLAANVREVVQEAIAPTKALETAVRMVGMGASSIAMDFETYVTVDLATVGHDLEVGNERVTGLQGKGLSSSVPQVVAEHVRLEGLRRKASAAGIRGWIDETALNILSLSGLTLRELIRLLRRSAQVTMSAALGDRPRRRVTLRWLDGTISGTLGDPRDEFRYERGLLSIIDPNLPETLLTALPGRPLGSLISHPLLPVTPMILEVCQEDRKLIVEVEEAITPITSELLLG